MYDWQADVVTALSPFQIGWGLHYVYEEPQEGKQEAFLSEEPTLERMAREDSSPLEYVVPWQQHPFWQDTDSILSSYKTRLFYAALSADERTALIEHRLEFATLAPTQQAQALYLLPRLQLWRAQHPQQPVRLRMLLKLPEGAIPRGAIMGLLDFQPAFH